MVFLLKGNGLYLAVAAQIISKPGGHSFSGSPLCVRYYDESEPMEGYESNRLRLCNLRPGTQQFSLQLYVGSTLQMKHPQDFSCEVSGQSAVITFSQDWSGKGRFLRLNVLGIAL